MTRENKTPWLPVWSAAMIIERLSREHRYTQVIKPGPLFTPIARSIESRRCPRRYGFIDVFLLRGVHAHQRFDCFDDPLGVANDIAVDLLRR
jgi:hypothetical protein